MAVWPPLQTPPFFLVCASPRWLVRAVGEKTLGPHRGVELPLEDEAREDSGGGGRRILCGLKFH